MATMKVIQENKERLKAQKRFEEFLTSEQYLRNDDPEKYEYWKAYFAYKPTQSQKNFIIDTKKRHQEEKLIKFRETDEYKSDPKYYEAHFAIEPTQEQQDLLEQRWKQQRVKYHQMLKTKALIIRDLINLKKYEEIHKCIEMMGDNQNVAILMCGGWASGLMWSMISDAKKTNDPEIYKEISKIIRKHLHLYYEDRVIPSFEDAKREYDINFLKE